MFPAASDLANVLQGCRNYSEVFGRFMELQMQVVGKARWGNNAPRNLFSAATIKIFFPAAKLIVCVRDIRAFLYSYKGKWEVTSEEHVERLKKLYHPVVTSYLWKSSMRQLPRLEQIFAAGDMNRDEMELRKYIYMSKRSNEFEYCQEMIIPVGIHLYSPGGRAMSRSRDAKRSMPLASFDM